MSKGSCPKCNGEGEFQKIWYIKGRYDSEFKTKVYLYRCRVCKRLFKKGERVKA